MMKPVFEYVLSPAALVLIGSIVALLGAFLGERQNLIKEQELRRKTQEIADLQKNTLDAVTGGDSFCYATVGRILVDRWVLVAEGENNLYEVQARFVDLDKFENNEGAAHLGQTFDIGTLLAGHARAIGPPVVTSRLPERGYNIFFTARNGRFTQAIRFAKPERELLTAIRVTRDGEVILERIDDEFPRNENGGVDW